MTSQDTLVAHLRTTHICPSRECEAAADALEAQASRITELEQFLIRMGLRPDHLVP